MKQSVFCYFLFFCFFFLFPYQGIASPRLNAGEIPVIRVQTDQLTPIQIGLELGRQTKALFPNIEKYYDSYLATRLTPSLYVRLQQETLPPLLQQLDSTYQEELNGVAAAWSLTRTNQLGDGFLSLSEYQLINLLPDLGQLAGGSGFGVFNKASADKAPIIGRNLDWRSTPELRRLQVITVYQSRDKAVVNIGFAGIISILTGFNQDGLFLADYKAESFSPYQHAPNLLGDIHSNVFDLRKVLETYQSIQQATHYLSKRSYLYSHSILMGDKKNIQVLEYPRGGIAKLRRWNSRTQANRVWGKPQQIAVIGCHVLASLPNNCRDVKEGFHWTRLRQLAVFNAIMPANIDAIADILFDTKNHLFEIFNTSTLQSMVYQPETGRLYLYAAGVKGTSSTSPIHRAYLNIIPEALRNQATNKKKHLMLWLIFALLLVLSAIVFWVVWQDRNSH